MELSEAEFATLQYIYSFSQKRAEPVNFIKFTQSPSPSDIFYFLFEILLAALGLLMINQEVSSASLHRSLHNPGVLKREMTPQGFYGDTFSDGFGGFRTMKRSEPYDMEARIFYSQNSDSNNLPRSICLDWKNCMEVRVRDSTRDRYISNGQKMKVKSTAKHLTN